MSRRAYGVSVSLDPALRVLLRPEGIGNLQIFSQGQRGMGWLPTLTNPMVEPWGIWMVLGEV